MRLRAALLALALAAVILAPAAASAQAADKPSVLVWTGTYGFRHPSITDAQKAFLELSQTGAFDVRITENPAELNSALLKNVDVLVWVSTTGKPPMTEQQRADLIRWAACGGGTMAFHAAADSNYGWAEYAELIGAQFDSHPLTGNARMTVEDDSHPITAGWAGQSSFMINDEWYRWRGATRMPGVSLPRQLPDTNVLLSLDETTIPANIQSGATAYEDDQPIAWTKTFRDGGRVYYNNMGHNGSTWNLAPFRTSLVNGVAWVAEKQLDQWCFASTAPLAGGATAPAADPDSIGEACTVPDRKLRSGTTWETSGIMKRLTIEGDTWVSPAAGLPGNLAWGAQHYVLDLSATRAATATVTVTLDIPVPSDDYDLSVSTGWGWYGSDSNVPQSSERVVIDDVPHCAVLQVYADNLLATSQQKPTMRVAVTPGPAARVVVEQADPRCSAHVPAPCHLRAITSGHGR